MLRADRTSDRAEVPPSLFEPTPERSMQPLSVTGSQQVSHTASLVREVLTRLTAFKLPPTPENFAWVYRQVQREQNLPTSVEYVNDLAILEHALNCFDQLFVADAWLNGKLSELRELIGATGVQEAKKRTQVKQLLEEVLKRKEEMLFHLAESSLALRSSISEIVKEIGKLSGSVGGFQSNLGKYQGLLENCHDVADARRVLLLVANDTKKLNESLYDHEQAVGKNFSRLQESGALILSNLNQTMEKKPAPSAKREISKAAVSSEQILKRVVEPEYASAVLLLVELADLQADEDRVGRFSEMLAARAERLLFGYWGGSQFVFVLPNASPAKALLLARELGTDAARLGRETKGLSLSFSYGIASYVDGDKDSQVFYKAFELAFGNLRPMKEIAA